MIKRIKNSLHIWNVFISHKTQTPGKPFHRVNVKVLSFLLPKKNCEIFMWAQAVHVHVCVVIQRFLCFSLQLALNIEKFHHYLWNWLRNFIIICGIDWEISLLSAESIEKFHHYLWHPITGWPLLPLNSFLQMSLLQRRTMHCGTKKRNLSWQMCQR